MSGRDARFAPRVVDVNFVEGPLPGDEAPSKEAAAGPSERGSYVTEHDAHVSWYVRVQYALPSLGLAAVQVMMSTFVPKFYSDNLGLSLATLGYLSLASLIFDALTDPLVGFLSDYTRTRWGRRRPWIFVGGLYLGGCICAMLAPPFGLSDQGVVIWASVFIMNVMLASTMARVPWYALGMELTHLHDEKTNVFATREAMYIVGSIMGAGLPLAISFFMGDSGSKREQRHQYIVLGALIGLITAASNVSCAIEVKERRYEALPAHTHHASAASAMNGFLSIFRNYYKLMGSIVRHKAALSLLVSASVYGAASYTGAFFFSYYVDYVLNGTDYLEIILIIYIMTAIVCIPVWVWLAKRFEKVTMAKAAMLIQSIVLSGCFFFVHHGDVIRFQIAVVFAGLGFGGYAALRASLISDVADADEWSQDRRHHVRREGGIQGLFDLNSKILSALFTGPALLILGRLGYVPNQEQNPQSEMFIRAMYTLFPGVLGFAAIFMLAPYDLTREEHARRKRVWGHEWGQQENLGSETPAL